MEKFKYQVYFVLLIVGIASVGGVAFLGVGWWKSKNSVSEADMLEVQNILQEDGVVEFSKECRDSDSGIDFETQGIVFFKTSVTGKEDSVTEYSDSCFVSTDQEGVVKDNTREYYCDSTNQVLSKSKECSLGCVSGICLTEETLAFLDRGIFDEKATPASISTGGYGNVTFSAYLGAPIGLKTVALESVDAYGGFIKKIGDLTEQETDKSLGRGYYSFDWGYYSSEPLDLYFRMIAKYIDGQSFVSDTIYVGVYDQVLNTKTSTATRYARSVEELYRTYRESLSVSESKEKIKDYLRNDALVATVIMKDSSVSFKYDSIVVTAILDN